MAGIVMGILGWVHQGSIFRYILALVLAPTVAHAKAVYLRAFALVATELHLYAEVVDDFDKESLVLFKALNNYTFPLYRLHIEPEQI